MLSSAFFVGLETPAATTAATPAAASFQFTDLLLPLFLAFMVYLMWNNGRKRKRAEQEMRNSLGVGAKVVLISGVTGTIVSMDEVSAIIESTPKVKIRVVLGAIRGIDTTLDAPVVAAEPAEPTDADKDTK